MSNLRLPDPGFNDSFENALRRLFAPVGFESEFAAPKMRLDVTESAQAYQVRADIPGVNKDDINVRIDGNVVQIDAEKKGEKESRGDGEKVLRSERHYGIVSRTFSLAQDVDEAKVEAKYVDGVLTLLLPKKVATDAHRIMIQ